MEPFEKKKIPPEFLNLPKKETVRDDLLESWTPAVSKEEIAVDDALGRVLAKDQTAQFSLPVYRSSAMDGIAVKGQMFEGGLPDPASLVRGRDFDRADTGDDFPDLYDTVIRIEDVTLDEEQRHVLAFSDGLQVKQGMNVRPKGSFIREGDLVAKAGTRLTPSDLSMLVLAGRTEIPVYRKPRIAFIPTGSELVPAGTVPGRGQMLDSNSTMMKHTLLQLGAEPLMHPIVKDEKELLEKELDSAIAEGADIIILNGGSSKGSEDYNVQVLREFGTLLYHGVATVPGRPAAAAVSEDGTRVGIVQPGPALACFNVLEWLIRPLVAAFYGIRPEEHEMVKAILTEDFRGPKIFDLLSPMHMTKDAAGQYLATPVGGRRQTIPASFAAEGFFYHPYGCGMIPEGTEIEVMLKRNRAAIAEE